MRENIKQQPTIAAIATAKGIGGVGVIRISGENTKHIAEKLLGKIPAPRVATHTSFLDKNSKILDSGIALFFKAPNSFTGEDVLELQGHGGPVILDCVLQEVLGSGVRLAEPGEFTKRAFLNNKIDLAQAEAVSDLIHATSTSAALAATNTLKGVFSKKIKELEKSLVWLRMFVEASIDFPEEEIDFLQDKKIKEKLDKIKNNVDEVLVSAKTGSRLVDGINVVILGKPNAGKSSLLNALSKDDVAIVTEIAGTTRDTINNSININGITLNITDTAGLRETTDIVEKEGIKRALNKIEEAEIILFVLDSTTENTFNPFDVYPNLKDKISSNQNIVTIINKVDKTKIKPAIKKISKNNYQAFISAKSKKGINLVEEIILEISGCTSSTEGAFSARRRHLTAIENAKKHILKGEQEFFQTNAGEILAEELKLANNCLSEIVGEFSSDDLLGKIFSEFCIGK